MNIQEKQQQNTERFLTSYLMRKDLSQVSGYDESQSLETSPGKTPAPVRPFNGNLRCGQIRLLANVDQITYIVLLRKLGDDAFLTMAFSHYDFPATDKELSLDRDAGLYLNVLQVWNTRTLLNETLRKSWLYGTLPEKMCDDAWTFWLFMTTESPLPGRLAERSGTPITGENDLRLGYLQEEMDIFAKVDSSGLEQAEADPINETPESENNPSQDWMNGLILPSSLWPEKEMALAAGEEKKMLQEKCAIEGRDEILSIKYSPNKNTIWVYIFSADRRISTALDDAEIIDENECRLGSIRNGECTANVKGDFNGRIALRLADGTVCLLKKLPQ